MNIYISAGHNKEKKGASFCGFNEHDEAVIWAALIVDGILKRGYQSRLIAGGKLTEKINHINSGDPFLAVEIHFNSAKNSDGENIGRGSETLYYPDSKKGCFFASKVQFELACVFMPNRGIKEGWYQLDESKGADYFLAKTKCPAIIVEPEFIHKQGHIQKNRVAGCAAIVNGIIQTAQAL